MKRRAIFLDRDGTVCEDVGYLDDAERLRLLPGSSRALLAVADAGFQTVLVTNQSGVARGRFTEGALETIHERLRGLLADEGARLDGIYYCPHHPEGSVAAYRRVCACRKPEPGMLHRARDEMGIDLAGSYLIGDHRRDIEAGLRVGATALLVRTGVGREHCAALDASATAGRPSFIADDLLEAVEWILQREGLATNSTGRLSGGSRS